MRDWRAFLSAEDDAELRLLRRRPPTGRPCGGELFVRDLESLLARPGSKQDELCIVSPEPGTPESAP